MSYTDLKAEFKVYNSVTGVDNTFNTNCKTLYDLGSTSVGLVSETGRVQVLFGGVPVPNANRELGVGRTRKIYQVPIIGWIVSRNNYIQVTRTA